MPCPFPSLPAYMLSSLCPSFWLFSPSPPSKLSSWIPYGMTWGLWFIGYGYFYRSNLEWVWLKSISFLFSTREPPPHQWFPPEQVQQSLWNFLSLCTSPGDLLGWGSWSVSEFLRDSIVLPAPPLGSWLQVVSFLSLDQSSLNLASIPTFNWDFFPSLYFWGALLVLYELLLPLDISISTGASVCRNTGVFLNFTMVFSVSLKNTPHNSKVTAFYAGEAIEQTLPPYLCLALICHPLGQM